MRGDYPHARAVVPIHRCDPWGALLLFALAGCTTMSSPPLRTVAHVDLDRYLGRWNVIANIPCFWENGKVASYDTYASRAAGKLDNIFTFRESRFEARRKTGTASRG